MQLPKFERPGRLIEENLSNRSPMHTIHILSERLTPSLSHVKVTTDNPPVFLTNALALPPWHLDSGLAAEADVGATSPE